MSISELRSRLGALGLDTSTPGLSGEDRREELHRRLLQAEGHLHGGGDGGGFVMPSMSNLPLAELRERLAALGESTVTPGLVGEARRQELMRRLVGAICGSEGGDTAKDMLDDIISVSSQSQPVPVLVPVPVPVPQAAPEPLVEEVQVVVAAAPKFRPVPPPPPRKPPAPEPEVPVVVVEMPSAATKPEPRIYSQGEISEMKKTLRRISNKRAIYVAAKLSGGSQDGMLKDSEKLASWTEAETSRLRQQKQKSKAPATEKGSSMLIENGALMMVDKVIAKLEELRSEAKEQIRLHRLRIRAEADGNAEFGVAIEESIKATLSDAVINKGLSMGRTRQRIDELNERGGSGGGRRAAASTGQEPKRSSGGGGDDDEDDDDEDEEDEMRASAFPSVGVGANKKGPAAAAAKKKNTSKKPQQPQTAYDARFSQLEAQGDEQMRGFEELLAELELEEEQTRMEMEMEKEELRKKHDMQAEEPVETWRVNAFVKEIKTSQADRIPPPKTRPPSGGGSSRPNSQPGSRPESKNSRPTSSSKALEVSSTAITKLASISLSGKPAPPSSPPTPQLDMPGAAPLPRIKSAAGAAAAAVVQHTHHTPEERKQQPVVNPADEEDSDDEDESQRRQSRRPVPSVPDSAAATQPAKTFHGDEDDEELMSLLRKYTVEEKAAAAVVSAQDDDEEEEDDEEDGEEEEKEDEDEDEGQGEDERKSSLVQSVALQPRATLSPTSRLSSTNSPKPVLVPSSSPFKPAPRPNLTIDTRRANIDDEDDDDNEDDEDEKEDGDDVENHRQIVALRQHARVLEHNGDLAGAEQVLARALELDPLDVRTLEAYGLFLHTRKGELARADAFFTRAVHVCIPDLLQNVALKSSPPSKTGGAQSHTTSSPPKVPTANASTLRVKSVIRLLLTYANFLKRSKGDMEAAAVVYRKAAEIGPDNAKALAECGSFLFEEGGHANAPEALNLLAKSLKAAPNNPVHALLYAKLLRKCGKMSQADIMYQVAYKYAFGSGRKIEATAVCNYATFVYRQRKDADKAQRLFLEGLAKFPWHKGLVKNYGILVKSVPGLKEKEDSLKSETVSTPQSRVPISKAMKVALLASSRAAAASPKAGTPKSASGAQVGSRATTASSPRSTREDVLAGAHSEETMAVKGGGGGGGGGGKEFASLFHPAQHEDGGEGEEEGEEDEDEEDDALYRLP